MEPSSFSSIDLQLQRKLLKELKELLSVSEQYSPDIAFKLKTIETNIKNARYNFTLMGSKLFLEVLFDEIPLEFKTRPRQEMLENYIIIYGDVILNLLASFLQ